MLIGFLSGIFERIIHILADRCIFCQPDVAPAKRRVPDGPPVEVDLYVVRDRDQENDCFYFTPTKHLAGGRRLCCTGDGHFRCPECYYHSTDNDFWKEHPDAR